MSKKQEKLLERMLLQNDLALYAKQLKEAERLIRKHQNARGQIITWIEECKRKLAELE